MSPNSKTFKAMTRLKVIKMLGRTTQIYRNAFEIKTIQLEIMTITQ